MREIVELLYLPMLLNYTNNIRVYCKHFISYYTHAIIIKYVITLNLITANQSKIII